MDVAHFIKASSSLAQELDKAYWLHQQENLELFAPLNSLREKVKVALEDKKIEFSQMAASVEYYRRLLEKNIATLENQMLETNNKEKLLSYYREILKRAQFSKFLVGKMKEVQKNYFAIADANEIEHLMQVIKNLGKKINNIKAQTFVSERKKEIVHEV